LPLAEWGGATGESDAESALMERFELGFLGLLRFD
jgi:hypothetical protein